MKKILLPLLLLSSLSVFADTIYGVKTVNGFTVKYTSSQYAPEGWFARIGPQGGLFQGDCFHDGIPYAAVKGMATCPGYFAVFPNNPTDKSISFQINTEKHLNNSPTCQESSIMHDPWN
jgi:hypothetical protein